MARLHQDRLIYVAAWLSLAIAPTEWVHGQANHSATAKQKIAMKSAARSSSSTAAIVQRDDLSKRLTREQMKAALLAECIQPDYASWERVTVGMSVSKVREILGDPLAERAPLSVSGPYEKSFGVLEYGEIMFDSPSMPQGFDFTLMTLDGKVHSKQQPLNAPLANSTKPAVPVLISPAGGAKLQHYPRFLDFRWYPSSGEYPISYRVEVQWGIRYTIRETGDYDDGSTFETKIPYAAWSFPGSQPGRWRVKAKNRHGESAWTLWRTFDFSDD